MVHSPNNTSGVPGSGWLRRHHSDSPPSQRTQTEYPDLFFTTPGRRARPEAAPLVTHADPDRGEWTWTVARVNPENENDYTVSIQVTPQAPDTLPPLPTQRPLEAVSVNGGAHFRVGDDVAYFADRRETGLAPVRTRVTRIDEEARVMHLAAVGSNTKVEVPFDQIHEWLSSYSGLDEDAFERLLDPQVLENVEYDPATPNTFRVDGVLFMAGDCCRSSTAWYEVGPAWETEFLIREIRPDAAGKPLVLIDELMRHGQIRHRFLTPGELSFLTRLTDHSVFEMQQQAAQLPSLSVDDRFGISVLFKDHERFVPGDAVRVRAGGTFVAARLVDIRAPERSGRGPEVWAAFALPEQPSAPAVLRQLNTAQVESLRLDLSKLRRLDPTEDPRPSFEVMRREADGGKEALVVVTREGVLEQGDTFGLNSYPVLNTVPMTLESLELTHGPSGPQPRLWVRERLPGDQDVVRPFYGWELTSTGPGKLSRAIGDEALSQYSGREPLAQALRRNGIEAPDAGLELVLRREPIALDTDVVDLRREGEVLRLIDRANGAWVFERFTLEMNPLEPVTLEPSDLLYLCPKAHVE